MLSADNAADLLTRLSNIDISVPGRTQGRTTEYTEQYSICRLLSTLANTEYLSYSLSLTKRERPDFLLCCKGKNIGIEITEATLPDYSQYLTHAESNPSEAEKESDVLAVPSFRHGTKLTKQQKNDFHSRNRLDDGWVGYSITVTNMITKRGL